MPNYPLGSQSGNGLADALDNPTVPASVGHVSKQRTKDRGK
jgi:hypothetical protein